MALLWVIDGTAGVEGSRFLSHGVSDESESGEVLWTA